MNALVAARTKAHTISWAEQDDTHKRVY
jgi:hypothetical protein